MLLEYNQRHICGGSLIQPDIVLTAAHCVEHDATQTQSNFTIIAADYNKRRLEGDEQKFQVKKVMLHENYDSRTLDNDIALIQLTKNATLSSAVAVVKLSVCVSARLPKGKIVNGKNADKGEYPWQMLLEYNQRHICGGSLIQPDIVLTAAHCVEHDATQTQSNFTIIAADYNKRRLEGDEQKFQVKKVMLHENYDSRTLDNDIALIQLTKNATLSSAVAVVKLSDREFDKVSRKSVGNCFVSGWGVSSDVSKTTPDILQELQTNLITNRQCNESLSAFGLGMSRDMICALDSEQGVCNGDSGGPMGCFDVNKQFRQVGIVSWGPSKRCANGIQIYTKVSKYTRWINKLLKNMNKPERGNRGKESGGRGKNTSVRGTENTGRRGTENTGRRGTENTGPGTENTGPGTENTGRGRRADAPRRHRVNGSRGPRVNSGRAQQTI